jgi:hypothetical protein
MSRESIGFPAYRKYKNNRSYFKILNLNAFEEIQVIGAKRIYHLTEAKLYPEKLFINDLLFHFEEMAVEISAEEYEAELNKVKQG